MVTGIVIKKRDFSLRSGRESARPLAKKYGTRATRLKTPMQEQLLHWHSGYYEFSKKKKPKFRRFSGVISRRAQDCWSDRHGT